MVIKTKFKNRVKNLFDYRYKYYDWQKLVTPSEKTEKTL